MQRSQSRTVVNPRPHPDIEPDGLLEAVQRQTFRFFWEGAHQASGCARDRQKTTGDPTTTWLLSAAPASVSWRLSWRSSAAGFDRTAAVQRLDRILSFLERAERHHGAFPHFLNAVTGAVMPLTRRDDGVDLVETALLLQGLICAREYFDQPAKRRRRCASESSVYGRASIGRGSRGASGTSPGIGAPTTVGTSDLRIAGWNECLIAYVLAAASETHPIDPDIYHEGFAHCAIVPQRPDFPRRRTAARRRLWRTAFLRALFLLRHRSARPARPPRRLLGAEPSACPHQPCPLRRQSARLRRLRRGHAGG